MLVLGTTSSGIEGWDEVEDASGQILPHCKSHGRGFFRKYIENLPKKKNLFSQHKSATGEEDKLTIIGENHNNWQETKAMLRAWQIKNANRRMAAPSDLCILYEVNRNKIKRRTRDRTISRRPLGVTTV